MSLAVGFAKHPFDRIHLSAYSKMLSFLSALAIVATVGAVPAPQATTSAVFTPPHVICLSPVFTGTPPNITVAHSSESLYWLG